MEVLGEPFVWYEEPIVSEPEKTILSPLLASIWAWYIFYNAHRGLYTSNTPLMLGDERWCETVLNSHGDVVEFLETFDNEVPERPLPSV